jgi:autophagy-related protein 16
MNDIYQQLLERNTRETTPFLAIHEANATLLNQVDGLQGKCEGLERETSELQQRLKDAAIKSPGGKASEAAANAALKSETRLRDKLEKLQEELNAKLKVHADDQTAALKTTKELSDMKDLNTAQEMTISNLREENRRAEKAIEHLENQLADAMSRTQLAEQQYTGLKDTIRVLTQENDVYRKENRELETRLVGEKGTMVDEMNVLTEMVDSLKREVDMLRSYKVQEEKRRTWFGKAAVPLDGKEEKKEKVEKVEKGMSDARQWGSFGVIPPSAPKYTIAAHAMDGTCVKYDESGSDLVATSSSDSTVKVWDTNTGAVRATLRGTSGHTFIGCDISGSLVVAGGSDKTTRVWNLRTERMVRFGCSIVARRNMCRVHYLEADLTLPLLVLQVHHLVGHAHKITCVRLFGGERAVITGSADRSLKVWDISQKTYRQTTTLRHSSTSNCVDVGSDSFTAVSGHLDGGLRFWDLRTGERTADVSGTCL